MILVDTDVAIHLRDDNRVIAERLEQTGAPMISAITLTELEAGIVKDTSGTRRALLDFMLRLVPVLPYGAEEAAAYGRIVGTLGYDRRRVLDRMIAAQAIVAGLALVTINGRDYAGIPDLELIVWPAP
jgi:predicted nucleic acid-binding protein